MEKFNNGQDTSTNVEVSCGTASEMLSAYGAEALVLVNKRNGRICEVWRRPYGAIAISEWYTKEAEAKGQYFLVNNLAAGYDSWRSCSEWERELYEKVMSTDFADFDTNKVGYHLVSMDYAYALFGRDFKLRVNAASNVLENAEIKYFENKEEAKLFARVLEMNDNYAGRVQIVESNNSRGDGYKVEYRLRIKDK